MCLKSNNWYIKALGPLLFLTLALMIQISSLPECAWSLSTLIVHHILLEMMNLRICSFYLFIPQIHSSRPNSSAPRPWGLPQCSHAESATPSSVFLIMSETGFYYCTYHIVPEMCPCPLNSAFQLYLLTSLSPMHGTVTSASEVLHKGWFYKWNMCFPET